MICSILSPKLRSRAPITGQGVLELLISTTGEKFKFISFSNNSRERALKISLASSYKSLST